MQNQQSKTPYKFKKSYGGTPEPQTPQDAPWLRGPSLNTVSSFFPPFLQIFISNIVTQTAFVTHTHSKFKAKVISVSLGCARVRFFFRVFSFAVLK